MIERKELNKLVIMTLSDNSFLKANQIYESIRMVSPKVFRHERVDGFRGFVKVLNSFNNVESFGSPSKHQYYRLIKE